MQVRYFQLFQFLLYLFRFGDAFSALKRLVQAPMMVPVLQTQFMNQQVQERIIQVPEIIQQVQDFEDTKT